MKAHRGYRWEPRGEPGLSLVSCALKGGWGASLEEGASTPQSFDVMETPSGLPQMLPSNMWMRKTLVKAARQCS